MRKRQEVIFGRAEKVRNDGKEREIVALELDGTGAGADKV